MRIAYCLMNDEGRRAIAGGCEGREAIQLSKNSVVDSVKSRARPSVFRRIDGGIIPQKWAISSQKWGFCGGGPMCWRGRGLGRYDFMLTYSWLFGGGGGAVGGHGVRGGCAAGVGGASSRRWQAGEGFAALSHFRGVTKGIMLFAAPREKSCVPLSAPSPYPRPGKRAASPYWRRPLIRVAVEDVR